MTTVTSKPTTVEDLIGQPVLSWSNEERYIYLGPDGDRSGMNSLEIGRNGIRLRASFDSVAPADVVVPLRDIRVNVSKGDLRTARACGHYGRGAWMLNLPGRRTTWHNTKGEAMAAGLRRLAIIDWHASLS